MHRPVFIHAVVGVSLQGADTLLSGWKCWWHTRHARRACSVWIPLLTNNALAILLVDIGCSCILVEVKLPVVEMRFGFSRWSRQYVPPCSKALNRSKQQTPNQTSGKHTGALSPDWIPVQVSSGWSTNFIPFLNSPGHFLIHQSTRLWKIGPNRARMSRNARIRRKEFCKQV